MQLTLLLPGFTATGNDKALPETACHAAFRFEQSADQQPWQSHLADVFGLDTTAGLRLPSASLGCQAFSQSGALPKALIDKGVVRADPVSLKADRDTAKLLPVQLLELSAAEADELLSALNDFVAEDELRFFRLGADEWFMAGWAADALASYPPSFLADRNASAFLPDGDAAARWRRLLTEIQMLLHIQPVNQLREGKGLLPVNSVWFWGGAPLPSANESDASVTVYSDNEEALQLAGYLGGLCQPLSDFSPQDLPQAQTEQVVVIDESLVAAWLRADAAELENQLVRINEQWLQPLVTLVEQAGLQRLQILTEDGLSGVCDADSTRALRSASKGSWRQWLRQAGLWR